MLQRGDLIFVRGRIRSPVDDAIMAGEWLLDGRCEYVHVAVYVGESKVQEAQGFRRSGWAPMGQYDGEYDIGHIRMTNEQSDKFLAALRDEDGLPYDWPGIFWLAIATQTFGVFALKYNDRKRRYCSKYVGGRSLGRESG